MAVPLALVAAPLALVGKIVGIIFFAGVIVALLVVFLVLTVVRSARR